MNWVYHGESVNFPRGLERVTIKHNGEETSNLFEENEMLDPS